MAVIRHENRLKIVRLELDPEEIPQLLDRHRQKWEPAERLEAEARGLDAHNFEPKASKSFVLQVIKWGRGHRFAGRFDALNPDQTVGSALSQSAMLADQGRVGEAVEAVRRLARLGQSFASKVVRFLRPEKAVVLDSVIRERLGYPETPDGYEQFLADCQSIRAVVVDTVPGIRICDVEAAIFAKIQGY